MLGRKSLLKDLMKELEHEYILNLGLDTCTYNVQWYMFALQQQFYNFCAYDNHVNQNQSGLLLVYYGCNGKQ